MKKSYKSLGFAIVHLMSLAQKRLFLPVIFVSLLRFQSLALVTHIQDCYLFSVNCLFHHHFPHFLPNSSFSTLRIVRFSFSFHLNLSNKNCNMHGKEILRVANSYLWSSVPDRTIYMLVTVHLLSLIKIRKVHVDIIYALVLNQSKSLIVLTTC